MTVTEETLIPATREEVVSQLNTLGTMTTSTEWERSALVYALTVDGRTVAGRNRNSGNPELAKVTFQELASWGIVGLTDKSHVAAYHKYWANAVAEGFALPAVLGEPYDEPETEWPGFRAGSGTWRRWTSPGWMRPMPMKRGRPCRMHTRY